MSAMSPVPQDHPLMIAWEKYKTTDEFANSRMWALRTIYENGNPISFEMRGNHVDGALWAAFVKGFELAEAQASLPQEKILQLAAAEIWTIKNALMVMRDAPDLWPIKEEFITAKIEQWKREALSGAEGGK